MWLIRVLTGVGAVVALTSCAGTNADRAGAAGRSQASSGGDIVEEARTFMNGYAQDLLAGKRSAIAERYDRSGAYFLGNGAKEFTTYDAIVARYRGADWSPPASFQWRNLSYEAAGPDAVVVAGQFQWVSRTGGAPMSFSYTALLRRQEGALRIRLEDESFDARRLPAPASQDTVRR